MLDKIISFSIRNKLIIGIFTLLLIVWGVYSLRQLPIDALPDITDNQVQIITNTPTLAAQEVEQLITNPIEQTMVNLPNIVEMRSFSRFGLSVITIVFTDETDIQFARQLISQKLNDVLSDIPAGMGKPELAPVTTGLGEIYQYVIHPQKGAEHKYSAMDLRTMQDWIVSRQLRGIPGVAEVTGFGGVTKQYEVSIVPNRLKAMNVSIAQVYTALEQNNENTGGAYIDKKPNAYFIRGIGMVKTFTDIENIVVKGGGNNNPPVLIRDVAKVQWGSSPRYGAMTYNGEKEVVGGIVMMLKGANSSAVVAKVKERMGSVQASLPADIIIEPFLDRTHLVNRAIRTVEKNLLEGALIVIFVLILFLGNLRAGLIVASAIPLCLLFALGLMNLFGVSANLMSLGAIDFGLIVDGAVIIVEATLHHLVLRKRQDRLSQREMDEEVFLSASQIRSSAAFGEIIILIVYIPILTLSGIEGKMFRPMAQTVSFAIIGALLLSLTYIPMMSALLLSKKPQQKKNFSDRMMSALQRWYTPLLARAIRIKYPIIALMVVLMGLSILAFRQMGGEFIPTLEEGDYAIEFVLPQGASLSQTIETVMQAERIVRQFPEVKMVVGKTGAADVATDPMPMQATDLMVILKDKSEWTTTKDFYDLADTIKKKLEVIPGVVAEPSQPIQMRFNELMTGVKQDVAVKIFGENIDTLAQLATRVARIIQTVPGVTEPQVERTAGLPQITVEYDRAKMAGYGITVSEVNDIISTAFAGKSAGFVYEDERRFELVVRVDSAYRQTIDDVGSLFIPLADGAQIPLSQVALVSFKEGPAQISREQGRRRVVVSFNVSGRDVQSVVQDLQQKLGNSKVLPTGYYYTYGGTFENLESASARLRIAVPIALLLILVLLYFTFRSFKQAALIFTAIPMSAIGGVAALMLRGMPFSISAGVGFIALFGVAVLNGIVLIGTFNQLAKEGWDDIVARVKEGTHIRLRPVLMTATVASLGFLPMAISSGAGAEVQKPLATVVIGGLITATILTLIVLPLLYILFTQKRNSGRGALKPIPVVAALLCVLSLGAVQSRAQTANAPARISFDDAYSRALSGNLQLRSGDVAIRRGRALAGTALALPKTGLFAENEDLRPSDNRGILKIGVSQTMEWPGVYNARRRLLAEQSKSLTYNRQVRALEVRKTLQSAYYTLWYQQSRQQLWQRLDSLYSTLAAAAVLRVRTGESAGLDSIAAQAKSSEIRVQLSQIAAEMQVQESILQTVLNTDSLFLPQESRLARVDVPVNLPDMSGHPSLLLQRQSIAIADADLKVTQRSMLPDFSGRFFTQRLYGLSDPYSGFSVSVGVPIFGLNSYRAKIRVASLEREYQQSILAYETTAMSAAVQQSLKLLEKDRQMVDYYESAGLAQADAIIKAANLSYKAGEISFAELSAFLTQAIDIQRNYLDVLNQYNQSAISLAYYFNQ